MQGIFHSKNEVFSIVLASELIKHMTKKDGERLIREYERVLSPNGLIILTSPRGFCPQSARYGNIFETHRSGWTEKDFHKFGFDCIFIGKPMITSRIKVVSWIFSNLLNILPQRIRKNC
ncbi:MAG: methyltransferase domain-containing protein [Candidatus Jordarchaeaceae archaeon]